MNDAQNSAVKRALAAIQDLRGKLARLEAARRMPIAVVGMACRFPGGADDPDRFWALLLEGRDAVGPVPPDRWAPHHVADKVAPGKMCTGQGAFLDTVTDFDHGYFGISPHEAAFMDPQQRLLLECAVHAVEDSRVPRDAYRGMRAGMFVGMMTQDYFQLGTQLDLDRRGIFTATGVSPSFLAGRLAHALDLTGPASVVSSACASSLSAVHAACTALRNDECDLAFAGGVNVMVVPGVPVVLSQMSVLSPDGRCRAFDAAADGYGRGEGVGMVVLKRLDRATEDGDRIHALVTDSAVNHNGTGSALTAPNRRAQVALLDGLYGPERADAASLGYVEAMGSGSLMGDALEADALWEVMGKVRTADTPLYIGSVKANIGHGEAAAGVASLIKAVLSLKHGLIPPVPHFTVPNPRVDWAATGLRVPTEVTPWPAGDGPRRAGVSAFGMSGVNVHLVLQQAPESSARAAAPGRAPDVEVLTLSARSAESLSLLADQWADQLAAAPEVRLRDIARAMHLHRAHDPYRRALVVGDTARALHLLRQPVAPAARGPERAPRPALFLHGDVPPTVPDDPRVAADLARVARLYHGVADADLTPDDTTTPLTPFARCYAAGRHVLRLGIRPAAVLGQGVGEIAAAVLAGLVTLENAVALLRGETVAGTYATGEWPLITGHGDLAEAAGYRPVVPRDLPDADAVRPALERLGADGVLWLGDTACPWSVTPCYAPVGADADSAWAALLAALYTAGCRLDWPAYEACLPCDDAFPAMPSYPFERTYHWLLPRDRYLSGEPYAPYLPNPLHPHGGRLTASPAEDGRPAVVAAWELGADPELQAKVFGLKRHYGLSHGAVGQVTGRLYYFVNTERDALFCFNRLGATLMLLHYTGPEARFTDTLHEVETWAAETGLEINLLEDDGARRDLLAAAGYSTTPIGAFQNLDAIDTFSLDGTRMRRFRYLVQRYRDSGTVSEQAYRLGTDRAVDAEIAVLARAWAENRPTAGPLVDMFCRALDLKHPYDAGETRLIRRDGVLEGAIHIVPMRRDRGFLMDMEFYRADGPAGCMEYGIACIVADLAARGYHRFSLGYTLGLDWDTCPDEDPRVRAFFADMCREGLLDGRANFQFKNKLRPTNSPLYLCRPAGLDTRRLPDFLTLLGNPLHALAQEQAGWTARTGHATAPETARETAAPEAPAPRMTRDEVLAAGDGADALLHTWLVGRIAETLGVPEGRIDSGKGLAQQGLDSLMIVQVRARLLSDMDVDAPAALFFQQGSVTELAQALLPLVQATPVTPAAPAAPAPAPDVVDVDGISDDEVTAMLAQMLAEQGGGV